MEIDRRQFLHATLAALAASGCPHVLAKADTQHALFASASQIGHKHWLHTVNALGVETHRHLLPSRAHQVIAHPHKPWVLAVSRRPGLTMECVDYAEKKPVKRIDCEPSHHLYGHAQFSADGRLLWSTENNVKTGMGEVVVRDVEHDFNVIGRFSTHGIGPHELQLMPDGHTLVVANGGIKTAGRKKLNLDTMTPSLVYLDTRTGALLEQVLLAKQYHQCSIRHLDVAPNGTVLIALQYQGDMADRVPLVVLHKQGHDFTELNLPDTDYHRLRHYCGSACFDVTGEVAAVSAPRGDRVAFWASQNGRYLGSMKAKDGCGLAALDTPFSFMVTTGRGRWYEIDAKTSRKRRIPLSIPNAQWDNHLARVV